MTGSEKKADPDLQPLMKYFPGHDIDALTEAQVTTYVDTLRKKGKRNKTNAWQREAAAIRTYFEKRPDSIARTCIMGNTDLAEWHNAFIADLAAKKVAKAAQAMVPGGKKAPANLQPLISFFPITDIDTLTEDQVAEYIAELTGKKANVRQREAVAIRTYFAKKPDSTTRACCMDSPELARWHAASIAEQNVKRAKRGGKAAQAAGMKPPQRLQPFIEFFSGQDINTLTPAQISKYVATLKGKSESAQMNEASAIRTYYEKRHITILYDDEIYGELRAKISGDKLKGLPQHYPLSVQRDLETHNQAYVLKMNDIVSVQLNDEGFGELSTAFRMKKPGIIGTIALDVRKKRKAFAVAPTGSLEGPTSKLEEVRIEHVHSKILERLDGEFLISLDMSPEGQKNFINGSIAKRLQQYESARACILESSDLESRHDALNAGQAARRAKKAASSNHGSPVAVQRGMADSDQDGSPQVAGNQTQEEIAFESEDEQWEGDNSHGLDGEEIALSDDVLERQDGNMHASNPSRRDDALTRTAHASAHSAHSLSPPFTGLDFPSGSIDDDFSQFGNFDDPALVLQEHNHAANSYQEAANPIRFISTLQESQRGLVPDAERLATNLPNRPLDARTLLRISKASPSWVAKITYLMKEPYSSTAERPANAKEGTAYKGRCLVVDDFVFQMLTPSGSFDDLFSCKIAVYPIKGGLTGVRGVSKEALESASGTGDMLKTAVSDIGQIRAATLPERYFPDASPHEQLFLETLMADPSFDTSAGYLIKERFSQTFAKPPTGKRTTHEGPIHVVGNDRVFQLLSVAVRRDTSDARVEDVFKFLADRSGIFLDEATAYQASESGKVITYTVYKGAQVLGEGLDIEKPQHVDEAVAILAGETDAAQEHGGVFTSQGFVSLDQLVENCVYNTTAEQIRGGFDNLQSCRLAMYPIDGGITGKRGVKTYAMAERLANGISDKIKVCVDKEGRVESATWSETGNVVFPPVPPQSQAFVDSLKAGHSSFPSAAYLIKEPNSETATKPTNPEPFEGRCLVVDDIVLHMLTPGGSFSDIHRCRIAVYSIYGGVTSAQGVTIQELAEASGTGDTFKTYLNSQGTIIRATLPERYFPDAHPNNQALVERLRAHPSFDASAACLIKEPNSETALRPPEKAVTYEGPILIVGNDCVLQMLTPDGSFDDLLACRLAIYPIDRGITGKKGVKKIEMADRCMLGVGNKLKVSVSKRGQIESATWSKNKTKKRTRAPDDVAIAVFEDFGIAADHLKKYDERPSKYTKSGAAGGSTHPEVADMNSAPLRTFSPSIEEGMAEPGIGFSVEHVAPTNIPRAMQDQSAAGPVRVTNPEDNVWSGFAYRLPGDHQADVPMRDDSTRAQSAVEHNASAATVVLELARPAEKRRTPIRGREPSNGRGGKG